MTLMQAILIALLGTMFGFNLCRIVQSIESLHEQREDDTGQKGT